MAPPSAAQVMSDALVEVTLDSISVRYRCADNTEGVLFTEGLRSHDGLGGYICLSTDTASPLLPEKMHSRPGLEARLNQLVAVFTRMSPEAALVLDQHTNHQLESLGVYNLARSRRVKAKVFAIAEARLCRFVVHPLLVIDRFKFIVIHFDKTERLLAFSRDMIDSEDFNPVGQTKARTWETLLEKLCEDKKTWKLEVSDKGLLIPHFED